MNYQLLAQQSVVVAALTSLAVQGPWSPWLREALSGAPSEEMIESWRLANVRDPGRTGGPPMASRPWLAEGLECLTCVSFWASLLVVGFMTESFIQALFPFAGAWMGARLLLAFAGRAED